MYDGMTPWVSCASCSGPLRYEYDAPSRTWRTTRDSRELFSLLQKEVKEATKVELDLDAHH